MHIIPFVYLGQDSITDSVKKRMYKAMETYVRKGIALLVRIGGNFYQQNAIVWDKLM